MTEDLDLLPSSRSIAKSINKEISTLRCNLNSIKETAHQPTCNPKRPSKYPPSQYLMQHDASSTAQPLVPHSSPHHTDMPSIALTTIPLQLRLFLAHRIILYLAIQLLVRLLRPRLLTLRNAKLLIQEHAVHILQTSARGLGVEEVGDGHEAGVEDRPDDVQPVAEVPDRDRRDVDDDGVGEPVRAHAQGDAFVTCAERHDFGGVHPAHGQDAPGEDVEEEEGEGDEDPG